ncbi:MAG: TatD family hydrolase, partial [Deltaproteobacteria bacterium]|nr:TatD family hydrolase [Deltaproteobacteria bacterium]
MKICAPINLNHGLLNMDIIDSHAHLFMDEFKDDFHAVLGLAREAGVKKIINVGLEAETNLAVLEASLATAGLCPALGWHPHEAKGFDEGYLPTLLGLLGRPEVVALGEIGLDYYWDKGFIETQKSSLAQLLELGAEAGKPVIIHCREAWDDFFCILKPFRPKLKDVLLHCYSG